MSRLVAFLTAVRRSRAAREDSLAGIAKVLPVWQLTGSALPTIQR